MNQKNLFLLLFILGFGIVNCTGISKENKDGKLDENTENLLLLDYLNKTSVEFLEINGYWKDNWNVYHKIYAQKSYLGTTGFWEGLINRIIVQFDNSTRTLYVKGINEPSWADCNGNGTQGENNVECYSRIVWTKFNDFYYYCEIVYNKGSLEEAKSDPTTADATNPDTGGCGGFSWTKFEQKLD